LDKSKDCHRVGQAAYKLLPEGWEAKVAAGETIQLDGDYQKLAQQLIDRQLAKGGLELATVLNSALGQ